MIEHPTKEQLVSIGEMARLNNISTQTLRYYDSMDLLKPTYIDEETGYRYYDVRQSALLFTIQQLKHLGIRLSDIKDLVTSSEAERLYFLFNKQSELLSKKIHELEETKKAIDTAIENYYRYMGARLNVVQIERIRERRIILYDTDEDVYEKDSYGKYRLDIYEKERRNLEAKARKRGVEIPFLYTVADIISKDKVLKDIFECHQICMVLSNDYNGNYTDIIPENFYVCIYHNEMGKTEDYARKLIDYCRENHLEIIGDFMSESVFEIPTSLEDQYMFLRVQFPVRLDYRELHHS